MFHSNHEVVCRFLFELYFISILAVAAVGRHQMVWILLFWYSVFVCHSVAPILDVRRLIVVSRIYRLHSSKLFLKINRTNSCKQFRHFWIRLDAIYDMQLSRVFRLMISFRTILAFFPIFCYLGETNSNVNYSMFNSLSCILHLFLLTDSQTYSFVVFSILRIPHFIRDSAYMQSMLPFQFQTTVYMLERFFLTSIS